AGKSRLAHELVRRLRTSAMAPMVLQCRGDPLHSTTPYALIAQAVRQAVGLRERDKADVVRKRLGAHVGELLPASDRARVREFLGELVGAHFDDATSVALRAARASTDAMSDQIRLAFADVVRAWCAVHPVLLVLEDLHWGDASSVKLIDGALRRLEGERLFVL